MLLTRIVLNQQQIEAWNNKNLSRPKTGLVNLLEEAERACPREQMELLMEIDLPQEARYDRKGNLYPTDFYESFQRRMQSTLAAASTQVRCAVVITNSFLRLYPTMAGSYRRQELGELDRFAVTLLKLGEPILVYGQDDSGTWSFVRSQQAVGWMLTIHLAWEDDFFRWHQYCCDREQLLVLDSRRTLEYVDFSGQLRTQLLLMGTRLPLYDASLHTFVFGLPMRDKKGNLVMLQTMEPRDGGFIPGIMPLSAQNIISQGKKMLGEPYGWGGTGYHRDCTSLLVDLFSVVGLLLPRNSSQQLQMYGVEAITGTAEEKRQQITALPPGSLLYFPGHAMLYLGQQGRQQQILHSVYALGIPAMDDIIAHKIKRVVLGDLQQLRVTGQSLLDAITACWVPERQKKMLQNN